MTVILSHNNYGKSNVRVLKVKRETPVHEIKELLINVQFEGDFEKAHTEGDNRKVLPTDTIKNTIYVLAKEHPVNSIEEFGLYIGKFFLDNNKQIFRVNVEILESLWNRIMVDGKKGEATILQNHSFVNSGNEKRSAFVNMSSEEQIIVSGIRDLLVLKTTDSGFENFIKDKFTTLKETSDRILSTKISAFWNYGKADIDYTIIYNKVRQILLETFALRHSLSVQQTLYEMGKNVIEVINDVEEISLSLPNIHFLLFNLNQFGMENNNEIFIPTDEPFGLIEATIRRGKN